MKTLYEILKDKVGNSEDGVTVTLDEDNQLVTVKSKIRIGEENPQYEVTSRYCNHGSETEVTNKLLSEGVDIYFGRFRRLYRSEENIPVSLLVNQVKAVEVANNQNVSVMDGIPEDIVVASGDKYFAYKGNFSIIKSKKGER